MAALSNSTSLDNLLFNFSPPTKVVGGPTGPGKRFSAFHKSANVLPSPPTSSAMHCLQPLDLESSTMLGERVQNWFDLWQQQLIRWELFHSKGLQLANSSRRINGGAIFSAVSWSKSLPITVLGSCNILECNSKVFFRPNLLFVFVVILKQ